MFEYETRLSNRPPIDASMQAQALHGMRAFGPQAGNAGDVYRARASESAADYARKASLANMNYATNQQQVQQGLALQGLRQMAEAQQNAQQYYDSMAGSLLGGLLRE